MGPAKRRKGIVRNVQVWRVKGLKWHADHEALDDGGLVDIDMNPVCADRAVGRGGCVYGIAIVAMHRETRTVKDQSFIRGDKLRSESLTSAFKKKVDAIACLVC